jgi:hypothetical protein
MESQDACSFLAYSRCSVTGLAQQSQRSVHASVQSSALLARVASLQVEPSVLLREKCRTLYACMYTALTLLGETRHTTPRVREKRTRVLAFHTDS